MIPFGAYEPDRAQLGSGLSAEALNVRPGPDHYLPLPDLAAYSTGALDDACLGGISVRNTAGDSLIYAADATKLYQLASSLSWTDRSVGGGYSLTAGERWWFQKWGSQVVAGSGSVAAQEISIDGGTAFAALGGSPPAARYAGIIGPHLILASLTSTPNVIRTSAANDITNWNTGGGANGISQEFRNYGWVRGVSPGRLQGYIWQDEAVWRASLTQDNAIFDFSLVAEGIGLLAPWAKVETLGATYFLGTDGFYKFDGAGFTRIGKGRVDLTFLTDVDDNLVLRTWGAADPTDSIVYWVYYSGGNGTAYADKVLMYNYAYDRWAHGTLDASVLFPSVPLPVSVDDLDTLFPSLNLDTIPWSLDDRIFQGIFPSLAAFGSDNKLSYFTGTNLAATIETAEAQITPGRRSFVQAISPLVDTSAATVSVGVRERQADSFTFGSDIAMETHGECPQRASGRFHRARLKIPAGTTWTKAQGLDFRAVPDGFR